MLPICIPPMHDNTSTFYHRPVLSIWWYRTANTGRAQATQALEAISVTYTAFSAWRISRMAFKVSNIHSAASMAGRGLGLYLSLLPSDFYTLIQNTSNIDSKYRWWKWWETQKIHTVCFQPSREPLIWNVSQRQRGIQYLKQYPGSS